MNETTNSKKGISICAGIFFLLYVSFNFLINKVYYGASLSILELINYIATILIAVGCFVKNDVMKIPGWGLATLCSFYYLVRNLSYGAFVSVFSQFFFLSYTAFMLVLVIVRCKNKNSGFMNLWFLPFVLFLIGTSERIFDVSYLVSAPLSISIPHILADSILYDLKFLSIFFMGLSVKKTYEKVNNL